MCVVDVETTGDKVGFNDVIEVCVLPLDNHYKPNLKLVVPFHCLIKPRRPENCTAEVIDKIHFREKICHATIHGLDADHAAVLFDEWYLKLGLRDNKRICPLGQNYAFDRSFMIDWLGHESYSRYFDGRYRDTMVASLFLNDRADVHNEAIPFAKNNLAWLAVKTDVEQDRAHDALADCMTTAEVYRQMILRTMT
jgi:DNA polymerase III epsilon subunit-like protein